MTDYDTGYGDLDAAVADILERAEERIAEKEDEHEHAGWRGESPFAQLDIMSRTHWQELDDALLREERHDAVLKEAADIVNRLAMILASVREHEADGPE